MNSPFINYQSDKPKEDGNLDQNLDAMPFVETNEEPSDRCSIPYSLYLHKNDDALALELFCCLMCSPLALSASIEGNGDIRNSTIDNSLSSSYAPFCLSSYFIAVRSRTVLGTLFLATGLAKFVLPPDTRRLIPLGNNALALQRGVLHPLHIPPPLTGPPGAADVFALTSFP